MRHYDTHIYGKYNKQDIMTCRNSAYRQEKTHYENNLAPPTWPKESPSPHSQPLFLSVHPKIQSEWVQIV